MNLTEIYALTAGQKISRSEIVPEYYPTDLKKYITIQPYSKPIKNYNFWDDVVRSLRDLVPEYEIVQIGANGEAPLQFCKHFQGKTTVRQAAFLIQNASLHLGVDSFGGHLAGVFNVPSVILYGNNFVHNVCPYFLDKSKFRSFVPTKNELPIFAIDIGYQPLDEIRPHEVVAGVLDLLGVKDKTPIKYEHIGQVYNKKILELIPSSSYNSRQINFDCLAVRMDVIFNEAVLEEQCRTSKVVIFTDQKISIPLLKRIKPQITDLIFEIKDVASLDIKWFQELTKLGIGFNLLTKLTEEQIRPIKLDFCELANIHITEVKTKPEGVEAKYYLSGKLVVADGKFYSSIYDYKLGKASDVSKLLDIKECGTGDFWLEADHFALIN